jgi:hypothetical protein
LGVDKIKGKSFSLTPMDNEEIESFHAYSGAGDQRNIGAGEAAKFGVGTIVRSLNLRLDDFPHTGAQSYGAIQNRNTFLQQL